MSSWAQWCSLTESRARRRRSLRRCLLQRKRRSDHSPRAAIATALCQYRATTARASSQTSHRLLALLLARRGVPVLVHGVTVDPGRVTSAEIFAELDLPAARSIDEIDPALAHARVAFAPIDVLAPKMSRLLGLRATLGVRNTTHTLVKLLQPFAEPGLRLVNYTHPAYRDSLSALFRDFPQAAAGGVLLARGTEGEAAADTQRRVQVDWLHDQVCETLVDTERASTQAPVVELPDALDAATTARWITDVLDGHARAPEAIVKQVELIERVARWKESGQAPCA